MPKEPEDASIPQQEEEKVATSSPPQQVDEEVTAQGTPDRIIIEILHDILEEAMKEQDTNKEKEHLITIEEDEVIETLQEMANSIEPSPSSPCQEQMELLTEDQVQKIAKETTPVQQEAQQIILLSRLSRQDKRKDKMEDSALLQHMLQEPAGTSTQEHDEEDEPQCPSLQESLQATIAHLRNIQYHHLHDQEELQLAKAQSLALAAINDKLHQKVQDLHTQLAIANSLVDAKQTRH